MNNRCTEKFVHLWNMVVLGKCCARAYDTFRIRKSPEPRRGWDHKPFTPASVLRVRPIRRN